MRYTDWKTVDTLGKFQASEKRDWILDKERMLMGSGWQTLEYKPCGKQQSTTWEQYRICKITGIRQVRNRSQGYKYIPPPRTEYDSFVDSIYAITRPKLDSLGSMLGTSLSYPGRLIVGSGNVFYDSKSGTISSVPVNKKKKRKK